MIGVLTAALIFAEPPAAARDRSDQIRARHAICHLLATGAVDLNLADCLRLDEAPEAVFRAEVCAFLRDTGQLRDHDLPSHAQCIRHGLAR